MLGLRSQEALAASGPEHGHQDVSGLPDSPDAKPEAPALSMALRWSETAAHPVKLGKMEADQGGTIIRIDIGTTPSAVSRGLERPATWGPYPYRERRRRKSPGPYQNLEVGDRKR